MSSDLDSNPPAPDDDIHSYVAKLDRRIVRIDERLSEIVRTMTTLRNLFTGLLAVGIGALILIGVYKERVDTLRREVDQMQQQAADRGPRARIQHD